MIWGIRIYRERKESGKVVIDASDNNDLPEKD